MDWLAIVYVCDKSSLWQYILSLKLHVLPGLFPKKPKVVFFVHMKTCNVLFFILVACKVLGSAEHLTHNLIYFFEPPPIRLLHMVLFSSIGVEFACTLGNCSRPYQLISSRLQCIWSVKLARSRWLLAFLELVINWC